MADPKLDGSEQIKPVPYDAHEQVVSGPHEYVAGVGYVPAELTEEQKKAQSEPLAAPAPAAEKEGEDAKQ